VALYWTGPDVPVEQTLARKAAQLVLRLYAERRARMREAAERAARADVRHGLHIGPHFPLSVGVARRRSPLRHLPHEEPLFRGHSVHDWRHLPF
jgi:hypothetical protein